MLRTVVLSFFGGITLVGCEEPIELDIALRKPQLVIQSNFMPDEAVRLRVSASRPSGGASVVVDDATVTLYEEDEFVEELIYVREPAEAISGGGFYQTAAFRPQIGERYTVHVSGDGYDPVTAVSSIPQPVPFTDLRMTSFSSARRDGKRLYAMHLDVGYADPGDEVNYYDLRIYQRVVPFEVTARGDTTLLPALLKTVGAPGRVQQPDKTLSLLLQDVGVAGSIGVDVQSQLDATKEVLSEVVIELRTVSPEYYLFQRSLGPKLSSPAGGLHEPVILFNNVESGLGIFAGYTATRASLPITAVR